ncbi:sugar phosphate isomerase/epimerase [bacterium]|nr:sugar phosphate isomerase/epimerase [bacterium]
MDLITRRHFLGKSLAIGGGLSALSSIAPVILNSFPRPTQDDISLAEWSLVGKIRNGEITNLDVPQICREEFDINGLEFVNTLFENPTSGYLQRLKRNAEDNGVKLVLIMVDDEGSMASAVQEERKQTVINHRKWIDIAQFLGCHAIRTNCRGPADATPENLLNYAEESFHLLLEYAKEAKINVIIENHGGISSDPDFLVALMNRFNDPDFGLLPDLGNFPDDIRTEAIRKVAPYAKGISVKTYYDVDGNHPRYDVEALIKMVHDLGYSGFWGIEAEGSELDSYEQIKLTKRAIERILWGKE